MKELWDLQKSFNDKFWDSRGGYPKGEAALTAATKDYALHLIKEVTEILDELSFKMHRERKQDVDPSNVIEELIDCQKFLWGIFQIWGFTHDDFVHEFKRKSMVVEQRWAQERAILSMVNEPCALIDIDGILADWDSGFFEWVKCFYSKRSLTTYEIKQWYMLSGVAVQEDAKRQFRMSGAKARLPVLPGARELLETLRKDGRVKIVLLTNRPYDEHYRIYPDTLEWLERECLPYDAILWASDKGFEAVKRFKNVAWAVDDKAKNVTRLREAGITTVHLNPNDPERNTEAFAKWVAYALDHAIIAENVGHAWSEETSK